MCNPLKLWQFVRGFLISGLLESDSPSRHLSASGNMFTCFFHVRVDDGDDDGGDDGDDDGDDEYFDEIIIYKGRGEENENGIMFTLFLPCL